MRSEPKAPVVQMGAGGANVFLLRGEGGNVLVDAGNPGQAERILGQMARLGVAPGDVRLILITHGHVDHFGSAAALRREIGAPVAIHALDAPALRQGIHHPDSLRPTSRLVALLQQLPLQATAGRAEGLEPDLTFEGEWRLDEYGVTARVLPTPGHTPGSTTVLLDSGEAVVGDMLTGFLRRPGPPIVAWDLERNRESLRHLLALSPHILYVGHGGPLSPSALQRLAMGA